MEIITKQLVNTQYSGQERTTKIMDLENENHVKLISFYKKEKVEKENKYIFGYVPMHSSSYKLNIEEIKTENEVLKIMLSYEAQGFVTQDMTGWVVFLEVSDENDEIKKVEIDVLEK